MAGTAQWCSLRLPIAGILPPSPPRPPSSTGAGEDRGRPSRLKHWAQRSRAGPHAPLGSSWAVHPGNAFLPNTPRLRFCLPHRVPVPSWLASSRRSSSEQAGPGRHPGLSHHHRPSPVLPSKGAWLCVSHRQDVKLPTHHSLAGSSKAVIVGRNFPAE